MTALAIAYAVALNTVLPALAGLLSPAMGGGTGAWVLCSAGKVADADQGLPDHPQPACPGSLACAMPACPGAALRAADASGLILAAPIALRPAPRPNGHPSARLRLGSGHFARGPPAA
jgi:hypothetical protein